MSYCERKSWDPENMRAAIAAYKKEGMSIYAAAKQYNVPRMTLSDRVHGKVAADPIIGHPSLTNQKTRK